MDMIEKLQYSMRVTLVRIQASIKEQLTRESITRLVLTVLILFHNA